MPIPEVKVHSNSNLDLDTGLISLTQKRADSEESISVK